MIEISEEQLAELIARLPPPPSGWVEAAIELPQARGAIDELVVRARADEAARQAILAGLEDALRGVGVEPHPQLVKTLRFRLSAAE